ncbi:MAG: leucyl/phenylalanyl-tRNA--protein transferase [Chromatiales bacterium]|jgi:leucyl/phenylalanyl-tRNA---protein transferase|nr:leucyl/phenylalanyl-tRNA--protein transferase [Chromatiales bacterium]
MSALTWLTPGLPDQAFPPTRHALVEPNGLLAAGGDLSPARLLAAYERGIFPWYSEGDPLLWWTPNPRSVLFPGELRVTRSLRKRIRSEKFSIRINTSFEQVMRACAAPRGGETGTWIDKAMVDAYSRLHEIGVALSVESWVGEQLVGGLYGVSLGKVFFGESMFARQADASKVALAHLCTLGYQLVDCQLHNPHLESLGARMIERDKFEGLLKRWVGGERVG